MDEVFDKWREKLLDAGKGNRLINYKDSKNKTLDILAPDIEDVFEKISSGVTLSFYDVDEYIRLKKDEEVLTEDEIKDKEINKFDKFTKQQIQNELSDKLKNRQVLSFKKGATLNKTLKSIKKVASDSISEKGINILYMAFGFLKWKEKDYSDIIYSSPLVLIPIIIENDSNAGSFTVCRYEEETNTNPTLIYAMNYNFGLTLPEFQQKGHETETLNEYLESVSALIATKGREVTKSIVIGTFSFLKMNMYKDLQENETKILKNANILKLLNRQDGSEIKDKNSDFTDTVEYFRDNKELNLHNVVDADSSQIDAIIQAKHGNSFVLQGPPGTGKSQTITNLIAEFLYNDKKILFVSEKIEALNVVYNNLKKAGLEDFCLELHSYKTNKKEVINELYKVLNKNKSVVNGTANGEVEELKKAKEQLDKYAEVLHTVQPTIERTPYQILGAISKYHNAEEFEYAIPNIGTKGIEYFKDARAKIQNYMKYKENIGEDYHDNARYGFVSNDLTYQSKLNLKNELLKAVEYSEQMSQLLIEENKKINIEIITLQQFNQNLDLLKHLSSISFIDSNMFEKNKLQKIIKAIKKYNELIEPIKNNRAEIQKVYNKEIFELNIDDYYLKFKNDYMSFFRIFNKNYRKDKKIIKQYFASDHQKMTYEELKESLKRAKEIQQSEKDLEKYENAINLSMSESFNKDKTYNWAKIENELNQLNECMLTDLPVFMESNEEKIIDLKLYIQSFLENCENIKDGQNTIENLQKLFNKEIKNFRIYSFNELKNTFKNCLQDLDNLENWVRFNTILNELERIDLLDFIDTAIDNKIEINNLDKTFSLMFYSQRMYFILNENEVLQFFNRASQDAAVSTFMEKDKLKFEISKAEIISKLSAERPSLNNVSSGTQTSDLIREANKKRKQKPVRLLLESTSKLVQTLKPCFLMSPLSVSTYLSGNSCKFDVVIFDEASQIFPWDAIGAIYRAKQVIVVGDSKQMPPSNYFNAEVGDESDDEETDDSLDFESILDLCTSAFKQEKLRWHYRSRNEDLITFSNRNFYEGNLVTFPSAIKDSKDTGVDFYFVENGVFDRHSKTNIEEAKKVVDLVFQHFEKTPERTLGVVAFSISQQNAIDDLIQERREKDDKFAKYFDTKRVDSFFVKNLETVQGDERDTIIFSIGYAKDSAGKFLHNFGPLNRKGGERRLNVAITRAKYNVKLVSSIKSFDIDLDRTKAIGAKLLKDYLDCAEHGMQNINKDLIVNPNAQADSYFETEVYDALKEAGYKVDMQVGCSGYKIDLGVKHPEKSDYILAVECDGATYHSGRTTRDRDRLRQQVLERLGWKFYRIWSTDWFLNKQTEKKKLLDAVRTAVLNFDKKEEIDKDFKVEIQESKQKCIAEKPTFIDEQIIEKMCFQSEFKKYEFYDPTNGTGEYSNFDDIIYDLVITEAPITEELLLKETVGCFGYEKVTKQVRNYFLYLMKHHPSILKINDYYIVDKNQKIEMRIPKQGDSPRDIMLISNVELLEGLFKIIQSNVGINKDGLFRTVVNLLGFKNIGKNIRVKLDESLEELLISGKIKESNEQYFVR